MMAAKTDGKKRIPVSDWMTESVLAVETFDSIAIARRLMAKHRINQLPVMDNDHLVGIVTDRDIRDAYPTSLMIDRAEEIDKFADRVTVEAVMTHDVFIVRPDTPLMTAVALLRRHRIGSLPVMQDKNLVGIITRSDILDFVLREDKVNRRKKTRAGTPRGARKRSKRSRAR
jgi:acetoin utilization protein AcuB